VARGCDHVLNRGNGRTRVFRDRDDDAAFVDHLGRSLPARAHAHARPVSQGQLSAVRRSVARGTPHGEAEWAAAAAALRLALERTLCPRGRPGRKPKSSMALIASALLDPSILGKEYQWVIEYGNG
jgi:hypothetical protein